MRRTKASAFLLAAAIWVAHLQSQQMMLG